MTMTWGAFADRAVGMSILMPQDCAIRAITEMPGAMMLLRFMVPPEGEQQCYCDVTLGRSLSCQPLKFAMHLDNDQGASGLLWFSGGVVYQGWDFRQAAT
jgi:hypothetical protein